MLAISPRTGMLTPMCTKSFLIKLIQDMASPKLVTLLLSEHSVNGRWTWLICQNIVRLWLWKCGMVEGCFRNGTVHFYMLVEKYLSYQQSQVGTLSNVLKI